MVISLKEVLGQNIKHYRTLKGMSQEELSELLNISQQTLSKIERGINFLTAETLEKIPNILGVYPYELFMHNQEYNCDNVIEDIERHLNVLKSDPQKLAFVHKLIKETVLL